MEQAAKAVSLVLAMVLMAAAKAATAAEPPLGLEEMLGELNARRQRLARLAAPPEDERVRVTRRVRAAGEDSREKSSDQELVKAARELLSADPELAWLSFSVQANDGSITLRGRVPDRGAAARALETASRVPGAREVTIDLLLGDGRLGPRDDELEARVRFELRSDPLMTYGNVVRVQAKRGSVRLTGEVDSITHYTAALRDAFSAGAETVQNDLKLRTGVPPTGLQRHFKAYPGSVISLNVPDRPARAPSTEPEPESTPSPEPMPSPELVPSPAPASPPTPTPASTPAPGQTPTAEQRAERAAAVTPEPSPEPKPAPSP